MSMNPNSCCKGVSFLRISIAALMLFGHGLPKLQNFSQIAGQFPDPLGVGSAASLGLVVFAEFFCALLVMLGVGTRLAAIPLIITMGMAFFVIHGADPFAAKELALIYFLAFIGIFLTGTGQYPVAKNVLPKTNNSKLNFLFERDFD